MSAPASDIVWLIGKWFTFWGIGVRLLAAGLMQIFNPNATLKILSIANPQASIVVQELGFANVSLGAIGIISLFLPAWLLPAALAGGIVPRFGRSPPCYEAKSQRAGEHGHGYRPDRICCSVVVCVAAGDLNIAAAAPVAVRNSALAMK